MAACATLVCLLFRTLALEMGIDLYIKRVPTKDNVSDDPSRERYGLLNMLGASSLCTWFGGACLHVLALARPPTSNRSWTSVSWTLSPGNP